ncbi:MAG: hypothetical protein ABSE06_11335 [Anaerolineaceae bacterium]
MNERKRPSILRIIDSDYAAALALLLLVLFWLLFGMLSVLRLFDLQILRYLATGLTAGSLIVLAWRCWLIRRIFTDGVETLGEVRQIWFYRERGQLVVTYIWEKRPVQKNSMIPKNNYTKTLQEGQQIPLMVDRRQPKRAFLRDLYLRK